MHAAFQPLGLPPVVLRGRISTSPLQSANLTLAQSCILHEIPPSSVRKLPLPQCLMIWHEKCSPEGVRLAIPQHQGRISPVFDVAANVLLIDVENGREVRREERSLSRTDPAARASEFLKLDANVLICGAISAPLEAALVSSGVRVFGFVCGPVEDVLAAFLDGRLARQAFCMPGCGGRPRWLGQGRKTMPRGSGMGFGRGRGGGSGRGAGGGFAGGRGGRMGGPLAGGPGGECVCPSCGEKVPHVAGQPCNQMKCPKCGAPMTRA